MSSLESWLDGPSAQLIDSGGTRTDVSGGAYGVLDIWGPMPWAGLVAAVMLVIVVWWAVGTHAGGNPTRALAKTQSPVNSLSVVAFVLAMDSDLAPVVGQQVTWRPDSPSAVDARLQLLRERAAVVSPRPECDLMVRGSIDGTAYTGLLQSDGNWLMRGGATRTDAALRALATATQPLTFTCLPPRSGRRAALNLT